MILTTAISASTPCFARAEQGSESLDTAAIEKLTGASGKFDQKEGVFKVSLPRKDISVIIGNVRMTPPMGLTSSAAFKHEGKDDMVMSDLVLTQEQINPVMGAALDNGLQVTALHNHFVTESPRIMFMDVAGMGSEERLASAVGKVFSAIKSSSDAAAAVGPKLAARAGAQKAGTSEAVEQGLKEICLEMLREVAFSGEMQLPSAEKPDTDAEADE